MIRLIRLLPIKIKSIIIPCHNKELKIVMSRKITASSNLTTFYFMGPFDWHCIKNQHEHHLSFSFQRKGNKRTNEIEMYDWSTYLPTPQIKLILITNYMSSNWITHLNFPNSNFHLKPFLLLILKPWSKPRHIIKRYT